MGVVYNNPLVYSNPNLYSGEPFVPPTPTAFVPYDSALDYDSALHYDAGESIGVFFFPPTIADEPPFLYNGDSSPIQISLWRHYAPGVRGVNVFLLNNGTYVQDTATPGFPNSSIPYPINFDTPGAPIVTTTNWDGTVIETFIDPFVVKQYFGGAYNPLTLSEVTNLTNAGYGPYIVTAET